MLGEPALCANQPLVTPHFLANTKDLETRGFCVFSVFLCLFIVDR